MFNPNDRAVDSSEFEVNNWASSDFTRSLKEGVDLLASVSRTRGVGFLTRAKVDTDHASDTFLRRPRTEFIEFINISLIYWNLKK